MISENVFTRMFVGLGVFFWFKQIGLKMLRTLSETDAFGLIDAYVQVNKFFNDDLFYVRLFIILSEAESCNALQHNEGLSWH